MTVAAPRLYPHQWSWDAAFVAIGLAHLSVPRACAELDHLLTGQWSTGMIPHIVFDESATGYVPGPQRWGCAALAAAAPRRPATSGITQPPVHAIAVGRILDVAGRQGGADLDHARSFARRTWPALMAWHRWLAGPRRSPATGLVTIVHGWESGMDNSPRFDRPYSRVVVGPGLPPYTRADLGAVPDDSQRPSERDYDRYLWLVEELRAVGYDDAATLRSGSFRVGDVLLTAVLAMACDVMAETGATIGAPGGDVAWLRSTADALRAAVTGAADPSTGLARDHDERTGEWLATATIAGFAPLLCGGSAPDAERALLDRFLGPQWCGHPDLCVAAPPSTSPGADEFDRRRYWRGPIWPVLVWLFGAALARRGQRDAAEQMRIEGLRLVADGASGEYYEPFTGERLGSADQSWTAAVTLDWLSASHL